MRIPGIDAAEAHQIFDALVATGVWNAQGTRVVSDIQQAAARAVTAQLPASVAPVAQRVGNQTALQLAVHQFTARVRRPGRGLLRPLRPSAMRRKTVRKLAVAVVADVAALVATGCTVPRPPGDGALRYRDQVFTTVGVTQDLTYGNAPDAQGNPVDLKLDLYQPSRGHRDQAARADLGPRRRLHDRRQGHGREPGRTSSPSSATWWLRSTTGCCRRPAAGATPTRPRCARRRRSAAQHDAQAAVRWLRRHAATYKIDTDRIAMGGGSAGAVTSLLVDWRSEDPGTSGNPGYPSDIRAAVSVSGGAPTNEYIDADDPPAIFFHGTEDTDRPLHLGGAERRRHVQRRASSRCSSRSRARGTRSGQTAVINQQSDYFLYFAMDLAHAAR